MPSAATFYGAQASHPELAWLSSSDVEPRLGHGVAYCEFSPGPRLALRLGSQSTSSYITWEGTDYREEGFLWVDFVDGRWALSARPDDFWQLRPYKRGMPEPPDGLWRTIGQALVDVLNTYTGSRPEFPETVDRLAVVEKLDLARHRERQALVELELAREQIEELTGRLAALDDGDA